MDTRFSPLENSVILTIGRRKMTIEQITNDLYSKPSFNAKQTVTNTINRINKKCELYETKWFLNGKGGGRAGRLVWKEKR